MESQQILTSVVVTPVPVMVVDQSGLQLLEQLLKNMISKPSCELDRISRVRECIAVVKDIRNGF